MISNKPKSQVFYGIIIFISVIVLGFYFSEISIDLGFYWITGIAFGFILQRSRFCFTAAFRDPYLIGGASLTKALLIALAVTTIGFTAIKYGAYINGEVIPGQNFIGPMGMDTIIGSFMFGIGMVIAGGCASGSLMRTGEGFQMQAIALVFFVIGSLWGEHDLPWWQEKLPTYSEGVFLPDIFGWFGALVIQLLFIAFLYIMADIWQTKKSEDF